MIRTLALIAITGFVLSVACIASALTIAGGPFYIDSDWRFHHTDWHDHGEVRRVPAFGNRVATTVPQSER